MPYFPKTKILYIHIPKCYGTSVEDVLIQSSDMTLHASKHPPFKKGKNRPVSAKHTWPQHYTFEEIQNYNIVLSNVFSVYC